MCLINVTVSLEVGEGNYTVDGGKLIFGPPSSAELQKFI